MGWDITTTGCWNWRGARDSRGYGFLPLSRRGSYIGAHRAAYATWNGELKEGLMVMHSCDNPRCINPEHLSLGTNADNLADMARKGRAARGSRHGVAKLTEKEVLGIRELFREGRSKLSLAREFGVSHHAIRDIISGKTWGWLK